MGNLDGCVAPLPARRIGDVCCGRAAPSAEAPALTRRELEVLRLVAVGRTNREIASMLFLSPRSVDMHVRSILAKLACRSHTEATARAHELGLLEGATPPLTALARRARAAPERATRPGCGPDVRDGWNPCIFLSVRPKGRAKGREAGLPSSSEPPSQPRNRR